MLLLQLYSLAFMSALLIYPTWRGVKRFVRAVLQPSIHHIRHWRFFRRCARRFAIDVARARYVLVIPRRHWMGVTVLEALFLTLYLGGNIVALCVGRGALSTTAALLAIVNATPLFVKGWPNYFVDFAGVPLSMYARCHHFIGRVVVFESVLHAALELQARRSGGSIATYIATGAMIAIFCSSFWFVRQTFYWGFQKMHLVLALTTLAGTAWHVLRGTVTWVWAPVLLSGSLFAWTTVWELWRLLVYSTSVVILNEPVAESGATRIEVLCDRPVRTFPGSYFHVFFPGTFFHYNLWNSYPMAVMWRTVNKADKSGKDTQLAFLVSHHGRPLQGMQLRKGQRLLLNGPYGQDFRFYAFDTVMLAAKGAGILGILSIAQDMSERQRGMRRTKVNIFWVLEESSQEAWVAGELRALQASDLKNHVFVVWCIYPSRPKGLPVFTPSGHWNCYYAVDERSSLKSMIKASMGKSIVVACGDAKFTSTVRRAAISCTTCSQPIQFVESQYRPYRRQPKHIAEDADKEKGTGVVSAGLHGATDEWAERSAALPQTKAGRCKDNRPKENSDAGSPSPQGYDEDSTLEDMDRMSEISLTSPHPRKLKKK